MNGDLGARTGPFRGTYGALFWSLQRLQHVGDRRAATLVKPVRLIAMRLASSHRWRSARPRSPRSRGERVDDGVETRRR